MTEQIIESSGNVFVDLGFEPEEVTILHLRAQLLSDLREMIQRKKMTVSGVSEQFNISLSRAKDLNDGNWEMFSLEMLITLQARAGRKVSVELA